ncbi:MAG TPA: TrmH family RNA methyltransferase [Rhodothermales bacterium]
MRKLRHEEIRRADPAAISSLPRHPLRLVIHDVRSIHNVGSIFRTSDAAAVDRLYLTGFTGTPENPALHRTALGAQATVPWERHSNVEVLLSELSKDGFTIAALEITDSPTHVADLRLKHFPLCLVVGNEVSGIPQSVLDRCSLALEIPQYGAKHSLNVSVACGIAVFGIVEQYRRLRAAADQE